MLPHKIIKFRKHFPKSHYIFTILRFMKYFEIGEPNECWKWGGKCNGDGYGKFNWKSKGIAGAHVAAYVIFVGHRHGLHVLHSCDDLSCVNPNHLWLGTHQQNMDDKVKKRRQYHPDQRGKKNHSYGSKRKRRKDGTYKVTYPHRH